MGNPFEVVANNEQGETNDIEKKWQSLLCQKRDDVNEKEDDENSDALYEDDSKEVILALDKLPTNKQKSVLKNSGKSYAQFIFENSEHIKTDGMEKEYLKFYNFNRQFGFRGDLMDFVNFSVKMREIRDQKALPNIYVEEGYYPLLFSIENRQKDLEQIFKGDDIDNVRKILDFLVDTAYNCAYLKNIDASRIENYCQKAIEIIRGSGEQAENYYLKIKMAQSVDELEHLLEVGVKNISHEKGYAPIFNKEIRRASVMVRKGYDFKNSDRVADMAEKEKTKEGDGILKNANDFSIFYNKKIIEKLKTDVGLDFEALPEEQRLKARLYTLSFLKKIKVGELEEFRKYFTGGENEKSVTDRIKAFFSLEIDGENGGKLVAIGNSLEQKDAQEVFGKIAELTDLAQEKNDELAGIIFKDGQKEIPAGLSTELLRKAHQIILKFSTELENGAQASKEKIQKLLMDLEKSRIDIEIMAALLIATKKAGAEQNVSGIKGVEMEDVSEKELRENPALAEKLTEMYRASIEHKSKEDQTRLLSDFEIHKKHNPRFYLVYFGKDNKDQPKKSLDNLVGFMRSSAFDGQKELPEGERYLGAMNIDPLLQKFYFGENFLREIVEKEFVDGAKKLIAHVPENEPSHKITKPLGFETVAKERDYRDDDGKIMAKRIRVELVKK